MWALPVWTQGSRRVALVLSLLGSFLPGEG